MVRPIDEVIEILKSQNIEVKERPDGLNFYKANNRTIEICDGDIKGVFVENGYFFLKNETSLLWSMGQTANVDEAVKSKYKDIFFVFARHADGGRSAQNQKYIMRDTRNRAEKGIRNE